MKNILKEISLLKYEVEYLKYENVSTHIRTTYPGLIGELYDRWCYDKLKTKKQHKDDFIEMVVEADLTYRGSELYNQFDLLYEFTLKEFKSIENK